MKRVSAEDYKKRITDLRKEMTEAGIDVYYVPGGDFHMSEYVGDHFKCREFMSGFDGSNGEMVITGDRACLWTDGRYFIQAAEQLAGTGIELMKMGEPGVPKISEFLKDVLNEGETLGFDGRCVSGGTFDRLKKALEGKTVNFKTDVDLVGKIWTERPSLPTAKAWILDPKYTGQTRAEKLAKVREKIKEAGCTHLVIAALDDIAWLFQFRGEDIDFNPVTLSYALISEKEAVLYMAPDKASDIKAELVKDGVTVKDYEDIFADLSALEKDSKVFLDNELTNLRLIASIPAEIETKHEWTPAMVMKACKTKTEADNERQAHISDGAALTKIIYDIKHLGTDKGAFAGKDTVTELDVAEVLLGYRKEAEDFIGESFAPIVATAAHGAIIHYEPTEETNIPLEKDNLVLMDTGGQYLRGTTDVTRTIVYGTPTEKMKKLYTAVLKGNLALSTAVFAKGTPGRVLDILARKPLWEIGYDYKHGTGHGVGYLLNVHEGPQNISMANSAKGNTAFEPGMITSDEPGVYLEGEFGIRTENMTVCVPKNKTEFGEFLGFEVLTMVPYDRDLLAPEMLTAEEIAQINAYHKEVYEKISVYLDDDCKKWLEEVTKPLEF